MKLLAASLNINDIDSAYQTIRGSMAVESFYGVVAGILVLTFIYRLVTVYRGIHSNATGTPEAKDFMAMVYQCGFIMVVVALFPVLLKILEEMFSEIMTAMQTKMGTERYDIFDMVNKAVKADKDATMENFDIMSIMNLPDKLVDYSLSYVIGTILAPFYLHASTLFIAGRYMILLLLEMVSPIAIACFYNESTRNYFYTWVKNLLLCYLMVPAFILASQFTDEIVAQFIINPNPLVPHAVVFQIIYSFILKLSVLAIVRNKIWSLF